MRNQRRIANDVEEASSSLPGIGIYPKDGRIDLFAANICFDLDSTSVCLPCLIHLEEDYPISPPNVGFPVHFSYYRMGASYTKDEGPLKSCQVLCLNITGNFKHVHDEWEAQVGEGWSPSMTLSSLLVQLQSVLVDMSSALAQHEKAALIKNLKAFTLAVDQDNIHSFEHPFPMPSASTQQAKRKASTSTPAATAPKCYITGATDIDDVLGFGFSLDQGNASTPAEILSWKAYHDMEVRKSSDKALFKLFWPRVPSTTPNALPFAAVQRICADLAAKELRCDADDAVATVTTKLINGIIVDIMKGDKADATRYFEALLDLRAVILHLHRTTPALRTRHQRRIRDFIGDEAARHKKAVPNLGDFLALYICCPDAAPTAAFLDAYIDENFQRCVRWWRQSGVGDSAKAVFPATKVSRDICLFQLSVLSIVVNAHCPPPAPAATAATATDPSAMVTTTCGHGSTAALALRLDAFQKRWRALQAEVDAGGWAVFLDKAGCAPETQGRILRDVDAWIRRCAAKAEARGPSYGGSGRHDGRGYQKRA